MTFLDILNNAVDIPEAAYIKFLQQYKFKESTLHFFFEGSDDQSFYVNFIQAIYPNGTVKHYYNCEGKDNVLQNYTDINWETYNKNRVLFFTDKDLDDLIGVNNPSDDNIFVTKYYSIENYVLFRDVYSRFLREICFMKEDDVIAELVEKFELELKAFHNLITSISAWIIYCRKNKLAVNLNEIQLSNLFKVQPDLSVTKTLAPGYANSYDYICKSTRTAYKTDFKQLVGIRKQLAAIPEPKTFVRGKYELWFLFAFCKQTILQIVPKINARITAHNKVNAQKISKCNIHIELKEQNIFQIVAPRVGLPEDVRTFLTNNLNKLIA